MNKTSGMTALELKKQELMNRIAESYSKNSKKIISLDEITSENIPKEKQELSPKDNIDNIAYNKGDILINMIKLEVLVELTPEERASGIKLCNRLFGNIPIDTAIKTIISTFIGDDSDFKMIFTPNAIINGIYRQLEPTEHQNTPGYSRGKIEITLYQDNGKEVEVIPSKLKVFEFLLGDHEVNYYRNNFYDFIKGKKLFLEKEAKSHEDSIIKEIQKYKKILEMSHKLNTSKITKILDTFNVEKSVEVEIKKVDTKEEKEMKKRWKDRFEKGIKHLTKDNEKTYINSLNYTVNGLEILLLGDILKINISELRRIIKKLEKKTGKKYMFSNKRDIKLVDNTKSLSEKEIDSIYRKVKGVITFEGFFDVLSYVKSL